MSELKVYHCNEWHNEYTEFYIKSEADKVIAEKDAEIARLKAICKVHIEAIESMGAGLLQNDEEIRHQKYKRCLAMAKLCHWKMGVFIYKEEKSNFYHRWRKRWLEIAEIFKPNSTKDEVK